jgi:hypothetical protein
MAGGDKNKDNCRMKRKSGGAKDKGEENRHTKLKSAPARKANAAENPNIPRARKKGLLSQFDAAPSVVGPEPQPQTESQDVAPQPQLQPESQDTAPQLQPESQDVEPQPHPESEAKLVRPVKSI